MESVKSDEMKFSRKNFVYEKDRIHTVDPA